MGVLAHISDIIIPVLIFFIVGYGFVSKVKVYETFLEGAKDGLKVVIDIVPTLIGLLVAVGMLRASGFFELLGKVLAPAANAVGLPAQLLPLLIVKMFSSSAATGLVLDIFKTAGPDSYAGMLTSILMSCTDTMLIFRGSEEYLQRQGLEFVLIFLLFYLSPVVLDWQIKLSWQLNNRMRNYKQRKDGYDTVL